ncbi:hypothetical protein FACS1894137_02840 [Spirochaetia bacterium]|nr:hypothetical protein FACS1894137_02840 [Spirochaetia bacterium]
MMLKKEDRCPAATGRAADICSLIQPGGRVLDIGALFWGGGCPQGAEIESREQGVAVPFLWYTI